MNPQISELSALILSAPPPFIFLNDPISPSLTSKALKTICSDNQLVCAHINAVKTFNARLFYDSVLNGLANWVPDWSNNCVNWGHSQVYRYNQNFDSFLHGLTALDASHPSSSQSNAARFIISIERVERIKDNIPDLFIPLTRLAELCRLDICVIFISHCRWEELRPSIGASPDPYYIDVAVPTKEAIHDMICTHYAAACSEIPEISDEFSLTPYNQLFTTLFSDYASIVCDICMPFTCDPQEIQYVAAGRWAGFVKPLIDEYQRAISGITANGQQMDTDLHSLRQPVEDFRMRLINLFKPSISSALEALYTRTIDATAWADSNCPPDDLLQMTISQSQSAVAVQPPKAEEILIHLPRISKFILLAAYIASINPPKVDIKMFGRGLDEKKRKHRVKRTNTASAAAAKIATHLQGPSTFLLDRLIAILGALFEENDVDERPERMEFSIPGEYTDHEISRVSLYAAISELVKMNLLHRPSQGERLDGPPSFKVRISFEDALSLARQLKIQLQDLLWVAV